MFTGGFWYSCWQLMHTHILASHARKVLGRDIWRLMNCNWQCCQCKYFNSVVWTYFISYVLQPVHIFILSNIHCMADRRIFILYHDKKIKNLKKLYVTISRKFSANIQIQTVKALWLHMYMVVWLLVMFISLLIPLSFYLSVCLFVVWLLSG